MVDRTEQASVVVVGCGPGGAVLSYLLARSGVSVALLERAATFEREYRGFGWNPGVVRLFDEMDLLEDVLSLAHETVTDGAFSLAGEQMSVLDFDLLETAYPYALMMEQPALLERLVERSRAYDGFSFHPATTVTGVRENATGHVCGVDAIDRAIGEEVAFEGPVVVGADGRYSTVRESAGIDAGMFDSPIDLVWFKLPAGAVQVAAQGRLAGNGVVLYFGLGAFRDRVAAVDPQLGPVLDEHLDGFADTSLLDVAPGIAPTWTDDGLLLLGDAAHTASPIGAQGNPPAVEDAVVVHELLVDALGPEHSGGDPLSAATLTRFERRRRPTVERVVALQRRAARGLAAWLDYGEYVPPWLVRGLATVAGRALPHSRRGRRAIESFALGDRSVSVTRAGFVD